jgi:hypothetical protein
VDFDAKLDALERRLRELERDLGGQVLRSRGQPHAGDEKADPARVSAGGGQVLQSSPDPLDAFGTELRRLAAELVAAWDRVVEAERKGASVHRILLEAQADLHALAALERALSSAPAVRTLDLRAYAGGHASLVVEVS